MTRTLLRKSVADYLDQTTDAAPLAVFRICFGVLIFLSLVRFAAYGWIDKFYIQPEFFFSYYGFEWVKPVGLATYGLFALCGLAALGVALGYRYRISAILLFSSFTYIELMDKTTYLNHYYFISLLSFLLIFIPAGVYFSADALRRPKAAYQQVPKWSMDALKLMLTIVYFYAGLAKLNSDWLLEAMPLKIWLPARYHLPLIGGLLQQEWAHYAFSWAGALYDLCIPFFLWYRPTRRFAFAAVVGFHLLTRLLFPIGMFPYIMIVSTLIFFDVDFHRNLLRRLQSWLHIPNQAFAAQRALQLPKWRNQLVALGFGSFFAVQLLFPFRYVLYPGELFWTEEGYRFSWRVMLMEKAGYAQFRIVDSATGASFAVDNRAYLHPIQEKQMATQPDFILEFAHFLAEEYRQQGVTEPEVYVESYVALNGRRSRAYIDPTVNLAAVKASILPKDWILPFHDDIKGL